MSDKCHICGKDRNEPGELYCSAAHGTSELAAAGGSAVLIPRKLIESAIEDAEVAAKRTNRNHFVRAITFDLFVSVGITDDPEMEIGRLYAVCSPDGTTRRLFEPPNDRTDAQRKEP